MEQERQNWNDNINSSNVMKNIHEMLCKTLSNSEQIVTSFLTYFIFVTYTESKFSAFFAILYLWYDVDDIHRNEIGVMAFYENNPTKMEMGNRLCTHDTSYAIYLYLHNQTLVPNMFPLNIQTVSLSLRISLFCTQIQIHTRKMIHECNLRTPARRMILV